MDLGVVAAADCTQMAISSSFLDARARSAKLKRSEASYVISSSLRHSVPFTLISPKVTDRFAPNFACKSVSLAVTHSKKNFGGTSPHVPPQGGGGLRQVAELYGNFT